MATRLHAPPMSTGKKENISRAKQMRDSWIQDVNHLIQQVYAWAKERDDWNVILEPEMEITEAVLGTYFVPKLSIHTDAHSLLLLEPKACKVIGSDGRIDLYAYPTLYSVQLLRNAAKGLWVVRTDSGIDWPNPWSHDTFFDLAQRLTTFS